MSATAEHALTKPDLSTTFLSRRTDLRLVIKPRRKQMGMTDGGFAQLGEAPGVAVQFKDGTFRLPPAGPVTIAEGNVIDADLLRPALEGHRLNGDMEDGFWALPKIAPPPTGTELAALTTAAAKLDEAGITAMLETERAGWARPEFLALIESSLERVTEVASKTEAIAQEAEERVRAAEERAAELERAQEPQEGAQAPAAKSTRAKG